VTAYPALPPGEEHALVLVPETDAAAMCDCGQTFEDEGTAEQVAAWQDHVLTVALLHRIREKALAEHDARAAAEDAARRLLDIGLTSHAISKAAGPDPTGRALMSPTLIQRLGRDEFATVPRRRRRA
jgi:hypothetical protein